MKKKALFPVLLGNMLEFYDLGLYGVFAGLLAVKFFPSFSPFAQAISVGGIFAAGFIARPLGAIIFGRMGDLYGRKTALTFTMLVMGPTTFLIGCLPTYEQIGLLAPLLLTVLRLIQGLSTGGEYNSSAIYILEHTNPERRGLWSGIMTASSILGFFLASFSVYMATTYIEASWSWRAPFFLGAFIAVVGLFIRLKATETPVFLSSSAETSREKNLFQILWENKRGALSTIGVGWFAGVLSLSLVGFIPSYLSTSLHVEKSLSLSINQSSLLIYAFCLPLMGGLSDRWGYRRVMRQALLLTLVTSYFLFSLISTGQYSSILIGVFSLSLLAAAFLGPMHAYMLETFSSRERCRGISFGFSIGVALFGGTTPMICNTLIQWTGSPAAPALYFILSAVVGLLCIRLPQEGLFLGRKL